MYETIDQTQLDALTDPLCLSDPQADHGGECDEVRAGRVCDRHAGLERRAIRFASGAHEAGERLCERIGAGPAGVRTAFSEGADGDVDDARIVRHGILIGHPQLLLGVGAQVLNDDVRRLHQPVIDPPPFGFRQVED